MKQFKTFLSLLLATSCASGFEQYYTEMVPKERASTYFMSPSAEPMIVPASGDIDQTVYRMFENGYGLIGYSSFNGAMESEGGALKKAREIGAEKIAILNNYTDTINGSIPITTNQAVTTHHSGSASAYGSGGSAYGTYSGTSTTYVPNTTYVPYSVRRFDQTALYFGAMNPSCIGIYLIEASDADRRATSTNRVDKIGTVRKNSAAYQADLLPGDLVISTGNGGFDKEAPNFGMRSGEPTTIRILRGEQFLDIQLTPENCP